MNNSYWRETADGIVLAADQPEDHAKWHGWRLVVAWAVVIGGSWALTIGLLVWVLQ